MSLSAKLRRAPRPRRHRRLHPQLRPRQAAAPTRTPPRDCTAWRANAYPVLDKVDRSCSPRHSPSARSRSARALLLPSCPPVVAGAGLTGLLRRRCSACTGAPRACTSRARPAPDPAGRRDRQGRMDVRHRNSARARLGHRTGAHQAGAGDPATQGFGRVERRPHRARDRTGNREGSRRCTGCAQECQGRDEVRPLAGQGGSQGRARKAEAAAKSARSQAEAGAKSARSQAKAGAKSARSQAKAAKAMAQAATAGAKAAGHSVTTTAKSVVDALPVG